MQTPTPKLGSPTLIRLGKWHVAALDQFDQTKPLIEGFQPVQDALVTAQGGVSTAQDALIAPRMAVKLKEIEAEADVRRVVGGTQIVDGKKQGETFNVLCPKGLNAVVQPVGQSQVDEIDAMIKRGEDRGLQRDATLAPLFAGLHIRRDAMQTALDSRKAAYGVLATAMAAEMMAREDFCTGYSKEAGLIRSIYPSDRRMQDFFFDTFKKSRGDDEEELPGGTG
jgi:hypothetical protein